ncbi:MAG: ATP-binding protein [Chloroflexi bacterium]|nr:ATP-binding protein [Chloroflexota bacterium]
MYKEQLIREALSLPPNAIEYYVSQILADRSRDKALVEGGDGLFNVEEYAQAELCRIKDKAVVYNQVVTHWRGREIGPPNWAQMAFRMSVMGNTAMPGPISAEQEIIDRSKNAWLEVQWQGHMFDVILMHWTEAMHPVYHYWISADSEEVAKDFIVAVCRWNAEIRGEVLVFDGGCWQKDARLFQAIKGSTFDNLILKGSLKQDIREDLEQFFAARETYEMYGIPWKRGILFVGTPGNGKTHAVKAIINAMQQPCLYVKSFRAEHRTDEDNISQVFDRARKSAPCILVLEDLDSLLNAQNRSFFLNELDGFAANVGVVALATTNHPERLDPAILDRPSRFDRKYPFDLPELPERLAYINMWNASLQETLRLTEEGVAKLSEGTEGFSFAYLKELFLSSMMRWIAKPEQGTMEQVMTGQVSVLREQMISATAHAADEEGGDGAQQAMLSSFARMMPGRITFRG